MQIQIFKTKKNFHKKYLQFNANLYWKCAVYIVFAIAILSFCFGFYLFRKINEDSVLPVEKGDQAHKVAKERIDEALKYFSLRREKSDQILKTPSPIVDPSL